MPSRRIFLQNATRTLPALWLAPSLVQRIHQTHALSYGLFFGDEDVPRIRHIFATDPTFAALKQRLESIDRPAMRKFIAEEVRYNDQLFHILRLSDTAQQMALYSLLTGDEDAGDLAAECIRSIMKFDRWDYFLEAGERVVGIQRASSTLLAVALCADWLGSSIDESERAHWYRVMGDRGCEPCYTSLYGMRYPDRVVGWTRDETSTYFEHRPGDRADLSKRHIILDDTNLKAVPATALAVGAIAYHQQFSGSTDTTRWLDQAIYSLRTFGEYFERDGSYHEGISYANYTALHLLKATSILKRFGVEDLTDLINWHGYVDYACAMAMPTSSDPFEIVNFGDNGNTKSGEAGKPKRTAVSLWIASHLEDEKAQWFGTTLGGEHDEWALLWYDPSVPARPEPQRPALWHSDLDWVVARTGYRPDDLTVAMRSGGPGNHEHADRNSIIVKCFGEQLVADPYRPPYSFSDPSWMMRTTAAHSAVLVDGEGHQYHDGSEGTNPSDAEAQIVRIGERSGYSFWTSDATPAYRLANPDIESVTRTLIVIYHLPAVLVFDKLIKKANPSLLQARLFGFNHDGHGRVETSNSSFVMHRRHARLYGAAASSAESVARTRSLPIPEEVAEVHPFVEITTVKPSLESSLMTVLAPTRHPGSPMKPHVIHDAGRYTITIQGQGNMARCILHDTGAVPEFEVSL